ncbi:hypothetical protein ACWDT5_19130 [Rhodococcus aetherivorans]|uniref:Uncharacterized protein n=1 Tax=Rhodococcus aetherivorans TaxID=191292 RepID=A0AA46PRB3_9NOCA|nr:MULTISPECIES: hypothetical protein [Rhodococcus]QIX50784.1 hypothetical protein HFP48_15335 [Rhodococcus sp. DMU1]QPG46330.1 hypothetical protein ISO16_04530 [Rhodococcus sp. M8]UGQ43608.1 hypothetical protein LRQ66_10160 [Rhodococcus aetherivorans]UYF91691.1 hypothetical protein OCS65_14135 [Rhodococcus aetherivorans]WKW96456.1 hypothetical protein Q3O43_15335 [Rhodococcus aetherivorans]
MTEKKPTDGNRPKGGRPGPVDEGRNGGMATREHAPEIAENPTAENSTDD